MIKSAEKLEKYKFMKESEELAPHLPETKRMTENAFWELLEKYWAVVVKPNGSKGGAGVILVTALGNRSYAIHEENKIIVVKGKEETYNNIRKRTGGRKFIVQRRIKLATVDSRPFDLRIIAQRRRGSSEWHVTGEVAKVAGIGYIVTNNTRSKGTLLRSPAAIRKSSLNNRSPEAILKNVRRVALLTAERLNERYIRQRIFGLDMGLDQEGHVWIIEANRAPSMSHFVKLKDYNTYNRIRSYKKS